MTDDHAPSRRQFLASLMGTAAALTTGFYCAKGQALVPVWRDDGLGRTRENAGCEGFWVYKWTPGHSKARIPGGPTCIYDILISPEAPKLKAPEGPRAGGDQFGISKSALSLWGADKPMLVKLMRAAPRRFFFRGKPTMILHIPMAVRSCWRTSLAIDSEILGRDLYFEIDSPVSGTLVVCMAGSREAGNFSAARSFS